MKYANLIFPSPFVSAGFSTNSTLDGCLGFVGPVPPPLLISETKVYNLPGIS